MRIFGKATHPKIIMKTHKTPDPMPILAANFILLPLLKYFREITKNSVISIDFGKTKKINLSKQSRFIHQGVTEYVIFFIAVLTQAICFVGHESSDCDDAISNQGACQELEGIILYIKDN